MCPLCFVGVGRWTDSFLFFLHVFPRGRIYASPEAAHWWPGGCQPSPRLLWSLGSHRRRPVRLGSGYRPLPWMEWIWLHGKWRRWLPEKHWWHCYWSSIHHGLGDCALVWYLVRHWFLPAEDHRFASHQWPCRRGGLWFSSPLSTQGLRFGRKVSLTIQSLLHYDLRIWGNSLSMSHAWA